MGYKSLGPLAHLGYPSSKDPCGIGRDLHYDLYNTDSLCWVLLAIPSSTVCVTVVIKEFVPQRNHWLTQNLWFWVGHLCAIRRIKDPQCFVPTLSYSSGR